MVVSRDREGLINKGSFRVGCCRRRRAGLAGHFFGFRLRFCFCFIFVGLLLSRYEWMDGWVDGCFTLFSFFWWERFIKLGGSFFEGREREMRCMDVWMDGCRWIGR